VVGNGVGLVVVVGEILDVEGEDFGVELEGLGLVLVSLDLENYPCDFHLN
jgi:hypothetical protein